MRQGKPWQGGCDEPMPCIASQQAQRLSGRGAARLPAAKVAPHTATDAANHVMPQIWEPAPRNAGLAKELGRGQLPHQDSVRE